VSATLPYRRSAAGVRLAVRLQPRASAERILGLAAESDGGVALRIAVTAPPEAGRANDALLSLLARTLRLPRTVFSIALGAGHRQKLVDIAGNPDTLADHLETVLDQCRKPV
jgi:uncharacterized protein